MVTLTLDPARISLRRAWKSLQRWVAKLLIAMKREAEVFGPLPFRVHREAAEEIARWRAELPDRRKAIPDIIYAYAIEPHQNGYPHAHICLGLDYIHYGWLRSKARKITGMRRVSPQVDHLTSKLKASRYLAKYITKAAFSIDLAILTKGRRLFVSAIPLPFKPPTGWRRVDRGGKAKAEDILAGMSPGGPGGAWSVDSDPSPDYRLEHRDHWIAAIDAAIPERIARRPPVDWDGAWWEWSRMAIDCQARETGAWNTRWYHQERAWLNNEMLRYIARYMAIAMMRNRMWWTGARLVRRRSAPGCPAWLAAAHAVWHHAFAMTTIYGT